MTWERVRTRVRQPASAAVAGIIFAVILIVVTALLRDASPTVDADASRWLNQEGQRQDISWALSLMPFAGIAFLWFIAVIRSQVGASEDRFVGTVFLGSGLLFIGLLFVAGASLAAVLVAVEAGLPVAAETPGLSAAFAASLLGMFGARMAAVFVATVATVGRRAGALPRWLVVSGYLVALALLATPPLPSATQFVFPVWILVLSGYLLTGRHTRASAQAADGPAA